MEHNMEYPFGFGFALMENPEAMARICAMSEEEKRTAFQRISEIRTPAEMRDFLKALGRGVDILSIEPQKKKVFGRSHPRP